MAFERVFDASNASVFKFEGVGSQLEGYYMGSVEYEGDYGPTKKHVFQTERGAEVVFGQRNLIQQLPSVKPGTMVRITYSGTLEGKAKGRAPMKLFTVEVDKKNTVDVTSIDDRPSQEPDYEAAESDDDAAADEVAAPRAAAPKQPAKTPDADRQRKVQELLNRGRAKTA